MKTKLFKRISVLPFLLPVMLALTSCSTIGQHQSASAAAGGVMAPHNGNHPSIHHKINHQPKRQMTQHHVKLVSTHKQSYSSHHQSVSPVRYKQKSVAGVLTPAVVTPHAVPAPVVQSQAQTSVQPTSEKYSVANYAGGQKWLLSVQSIDLNPGLYKKAGRAQAVIINVNQLDALDGNRHYIQTVRWDGDHVSQAYINARDAEMMAIIGLDILENGYIETNFGTTIMLLGGNGHIMDLPGNRFELSVMRSAKIADPKHEKPAKKSKHKTKSDPKRATVKQPSQYQFTIDKDGSAKVLHNKFHRAASIRTGRVKSATAKRVAQKNCETKALFLSSQARCSVTEVSNTLSALNVSGNNKLFCHDKLSDVPAIVSTEFGSHTLSAN